LATIRRIGAGLPGRTDNDELVECTDPFRIAELIAKGLGTERPARRRR
jgi:hypothetical protein